MLNQVILVGRLTKDPTLIELDDGRTVTNIILAVQRSFKNPETLEYDVDYINCSLWQGIAESTVNYCKKGSTVGIKARLVSKVKELEDGKKFSYVDVVAEKITFINVK